MALFFALLPTDLQIDVFRTWLGLGDDGLRAVSALDIACCCSIRRPQLLFLAAHVFKGCSFRESMGTRTDIQRRWFDVWFESRGAEIVERTVRGDLDRQAYCDNPAAVFPLVEKVWYWPTDSADEVAALIGAFPHMKSLIVRRHRSPAAFAAPTSPENNFWDILATVHIPTLEELDYRDWERFSDCSLICCALRCIGKGLVKLLLVEHSDVNNRDLQRGDQLLQTLTDSCDKLQTVTLSASNGTADKVICFMLANKDLREVAFHHLKCTAEDVSNILASTEPHHHLKIFRNLVAMCVSSQQDGEAFARTVERFPSLDKLLILDFEYTRSNRALRLSNKCSQGSLIDVFAACAPIQALTTSNKFGEDQGLSYWIGQRLGSSLTTLSCHLKDYDCKAQLLVHCTQLTKLTIFKSTNDDLLQIVAKACKQLRLLDCFSYTADVGDRGMEAIFANCHLLVEARIGVCQITYRSLQAILDNRLGIRVFEFCCPALKALEVEVFKTAAKEIQLLPVPQISF